MNNIYFALRKVQFQAVLLTFFCFSLQVAKAQTVTTLPLQNVVLCACQQITIGYSATGVYAPGNVFTVQLSNAVGNFVGATPIGTLASNALNGTINCTIPCNTPYGTGYRVRTISSQPVAGGPNNGVDITIKPSPTASISFSTANCVDTLTVTASGGGGGVVPGDKYYINQGEPWPFTTPDNSAAMDSIFGSGNWINTTFAAANAATIFVPGTQFVLIEGGDQLATAMYAFLTANLTLIENWVFAGGRLFINAAPNVGGDMAWGFGGVQLNYVTPNYQASVLASNPGHPIFFGPLLPVVTAYTGNWFSHGWITGGGTSSIIEGNGFVVACEKPWGNGLVFFGAMTNPFFHTPILEAHNLRANIISHVAGTGVAPTYTYLWSTGDTTTQIIPTVTGIYTVTVTTNGCPGTATYNYVAPPAPPVTITSTGVLCSGANVTLDAGPGLTTYLWSNGATTQTTTVNTPGTYFVTVTNAQGCIGSDTITIYADTSVVADFTAVLHYGCDNDTVFLTNNSTGGTVFNWLFGDGGYSTFQNPVPYVYVNQGNFNITLIVGNPPCFDTMVIPITINHTVSAQFALSTNSGNNVDSTCFSPPSNVFIGTPTQNQPLFQHEWNWGDGSPIDNSQISIHQYNAPGIYTMYLVVTDTLGCKDSVSHIIFIGPPAFVVMSVSDSSICVGEKVTFRDSLSNFTQAFWYDFGDGSILNDVHNPTHTWDLPGTYIAKLRTTYLFCPDDSVTKTIEVKPYPVVNLGRDTSICPGVTGSILITDVNNPATLYDWSTGESSNSIVVTEAGLYWATSKGECATTDSVMISRDCFINIPNAFSPDGDGLNDYFFPRDLLSAGVTSFKMNIYNRWGENIFVTSQIDGRGWDGKYNGVLQPMSTYVYTIEAEFSGSMKKIFKGNVILVR